MGDVIQLNTKPGRFEVDYIKDDKGKIVGVDHPCWGFNIQFNGDQAAFVDNSTGEPFGMLDRDVFDTVLYCYLMMSSPHLLEKDHGKDA